MTRPGLARISLGVIVAVAAGNDLASAQQRPYQLLSNELIKYGRFQELPAPVLTLVDSAIKHYDNNAHQKSLRDLKKISGMDEARRATSLFRSWVYQWLALNYFALDSSESARFYIRRSLDEDIDIWPDYFDADRFSGQFLGLYHLGYTEIFNRFNKKRQSVRFAPLGTIARADYSYRFGLVDLVIGGGATVVLAEKQKLKLKHNDDLLVYWRVQRMRKNYKKLTGGFYGEFSLLLKKSEKPAKAISVGPILSYTYRSDWEIGSTFEAVRLIIGGSADTNLSQTAFNEKGTLALSYGNFEFYFRKWF